MITFVIKCIWKFIHDITRQDYNIKENIMLELKNICKQYQQTTIIDHLSITFPDTGMIGIQGKSGCGKSTLLYIMGMLDDDYQGEIFYNGEKITDRKAFVNQHVSFMMQNKDYVASLTVKENLILPCHISYIHYHSTLLKKIVTQLGIQDLLSRYPYQLSGGQMKRASLAKALLKQSEIILCDEPTGALYHQQAQDVMKYLKKISQNTLVIIVSHDPQLLKQYCDSVLTLEQGQLKGQIKKMKKSMDLSPHSYQHHTLWFYPFRQILHQRNKLMFLFFFQWIVIVAFFCIVTAIFGAFDATKQSEQQAVLKNIINVENKDGTPFENMIDIPNVVAIDYAYQLDQCQLMATDENIEATRYFLPQQNHHIRLSKGRMPQNEFEILVSYPFYQQYHDQPITLTYQQKTLTLTITGVLKQDFFSQNEIYFYHTLKNQLSELINQHELIIETKTSFHQDVYDTLSSDYIVYSEIQERVNSYQSLLSLAQLIAGIFIGMSLLISLLLLGIVESIIYFERKHNVAYLLSLGLSHRRLFLLSLYEAFLLGGLIATGGCLLSMVVYEYVNHVLCIEQYFSFSLLLKPVIFSRYDVYVFIFLIYLVMSVLSVLKPISQMMKMNQIEVLREE